MTVYSDIASSQIRKYVWGQIQQAGLLDIQNYYAD